MDVHRPNLGTMCFDPAPKTYMPIYPQKNLHLFKQKRPGIGSRANLEETPIKFV